MAFTYPQERISEVPVNVDIHVNIEKVVEVPQYQDIVEEKEYKVENIIEQKKDVFVDKKVILKRIVEVPKINRIVKKVPREKIIDVIHEKVIDNIIEVEHEERDEPVNVNLKRTEGVLQVDEVISHMQFNTRVRGEKISKRQIADFEGTSRKIADLSAENQSLRAQIEYIMQRFESLDPERIHRCRENQEESIAEIRELKKYLEELTRERDQLKLRVQTKTDVDFKEIIDSSAVPQLNSDIQRLEEVNRKIKNFIEELNNDKTHKFNTLSTNVRGSVTKLDYKESYNRNQNQISTSYIAQAPIQRTSTSHIVTQAPIQRTSTTHLVTQAPIQRTSTTSYIAQAPIQRTSTTSHLVTQAPIQRTSTSHIVTQAPIQRTSTTHLVTQQQSSEPYQVQRSSSTSYTTGAYRPQQGYWRNEPRTTLSRGGQSPTTVTHLHSDQIVRDSNNRYYL